MDMLLADERTLLEGMVDRQRDEMASLLESLTEDEARARLGCRH
jgi:hypothetical protein